MVYLIAAFGWWAILLYNKNVENYNLYTQLSQYEVQIDMNEVHQTFLKQHKMIIGEGVVFGLSILLGLLLIYRTFKTEVNVNKKLNDFLLSVTHELKTPIASLKIANRTLLNNTFSESERRDLIQTGLDETVRLENQVNNILTAAQLEQSYTFNMEKTNLTELIQNSLKRWKTSHPTYKIVENLEHDIHADIDRESISKVVDNIVNNAIKYGGDESTTTITLKNNGTDYILISIGDEGPGIPPPEKGRVWEKFYRMSDAKTQDTTGTGLGLWLSQQIIRAHKGTITIEDNKPRGSIFEVSLPRL